MAPKGQSACGGIRRSRQLVTGVVADEAMVVRTGSDASRSESVYRFNESGTALWSMIESGRNISELADHLRAEYGLSSEEAAADAMQFIAELAKEGLIEPA